MKLIILTTIAVVAVSCINVCQYTDTECKSEEVCYSGCFASSGVSLEYKIIDNDLKASGYLTDDCTGETTDPTLIKEDVVMDTCFEPSSSSGSMKVTSNTINNYLSPFLLILLSFIVLFN
eukprot:GHVR01123507.1.p1 GENE.GHVR01123507.1~~GHVR01123507.1.p1  ORF type:complete len:120 (-),score=17.53 GHVR01123507.1:182-541(-)